MTEQERNDYFYVCALIEYIARETKNHRGDIVKAIGEEGIKKLLYDAEVNHCLSFERSTNLTGNTLGRWFVERKVPLRDLL